MVRLGKGLLPLVVAGGLFATYSVLLGFGLQVAAGPLLSSGPYQSSATEGGPLTMIRTDAQTDDGQPDKAAARPDEVGSGPASRPEGGEEYALLEKLLAYLELRRAVEQQLAREFPQLGDLRFKLAQLIVDEALARQLDPWLVYAIIKQESSFKVRAVGRAGEIGLMQVMPSTARMVAERALGLEDYRPEMLYDPAFNIKIATTHLAYLLKVHDGNLLDALTAYNAGHTRVSSRTYARKVLDYYRQYRNQGEQPHWVRAASLPH